MRRPHPPRPRGDRGYSVLEAAITLPAIVLLTMLVVQWAIIWHARHVAQAAAQEALRAASDYGSTAAAGRQDGLSMLQLTAPHALQHPRVTVTRGASAVTVHVHATVYSVIPFATAHIDATAAGPVESWTP